MDFEKDSNREAFEAWFESRYDAHFMQFALDLDMYVDKHTQTSWEAWQAAKAQANKQFENFIDQAIEDSACADERRSLQYSLDEFQELNNDSFNQW